MEQIHKQIPRQRKAEEPIDELPELEPNEVAIEAGKFLVRLEHEYGNVA